MNIKVEREDGGPPVAQVECMDTDTIARFKDLLKERTRIPVEEQHLLYKMEELTLKLLGIMASHPAEHYS